MKMRRIIFFAFAFFLLFYSNLFSQEDWEIYVLHKNIGLKIDIEEKEYYNIFPYVSGFRSALFLKLDENHYRAIITVVSKGETKLQFKDYLKNEIDALIKRIDSMGKMKKGEKVKVIEEKIEEIEIPQRRYIENGGVSVSFSGQNVGSYIEGEDEVKKFYFRGSAGISYFPVRYVSLGIKGALDKVKGEYGSGAVSGVFSVNIPTKKDNVFIFFGIGSGYLISGTWNNTKLKNDFDFDFQLEAFGGGRFFVSKNAAIVIQPFYTRTFNAETVKDVNDFGLSYGISLFF
jgi:hypothetical protein